jgi:DNA replication protein DnaC
MWEGQMRRDYELGLYRVVRAKYMPYSMYFALKTVERIGQKLVGPRFAIDEHNRFAYESLIRWVHGDPDMLCLNPRTKQLQKANLEAGIYLAGATGTGKTAALSILNAYRSIDSVRVKVHGVTMPLCWRSILATDLCNAYAATGTIAGIITRPILCVHDLGAEPLEAIYMGNRRNPMRELLESRGDRVCAAYLTLITSNLPIGSPLIVERYGDRVESRLFEMCNYLEMKGNDRRKRPAG